MSESFLQHLLQEGRMTLKLHYGYEPSTLPPIWSEYIDRLLEFGLAEMSRDRLSTVATLTNLGKLTIKSVLNRDSALDSLVPIYIRAEVIGAEPPDFASEESMERIRRLLDRSHLVGELKEPILHEVERLRQADAPFPSVFKALAPCVEGILRNLSRVENLTVKRHGLVGYIDALQETHPPVLKPVTLQILDEVFRPFRNMVEHGHVIASEPARLLCEVSLWIIQQIHADYVAFKGVKPAGSVSQA
jgi:hypothetical protein